METKPELELDIRTKPRFVTLSFHVKLIDQRLSFKIENSQEVISSVVDWYRDYHGFDGYNGAKALEVTIDGKTLELPEEQRRLEALDKTSIIPALRGGGKVGFVSKGEPRSGGNFMPPRSEEEEKTGLPLGGICIASNLSAGMHNLRKLCEEWIGELMFDPAQLDKPITLYGHEIVIVTSAEQLTVLAATCKTEVPTFFLDVDYVEQHGRDYENLCKKYHLKRHCIWTNFTEAIIHNAGMLASQSLV